MAVVEGKSEELTRSTEQAFAERWADFDVGRARDLPKSHMGLREKIEWTPGLGTCNFVVDIPC